MHTHTNRFTADRHRRPVGGKPVRLRLRGETPTKIDDDMMFFKFAALIVANELMFGEGNQEYKRVHRYWVLPWIGRRDNSDTAFTLMRELQAVSNNLVKKERFDVGNSARCCHKLMDGSTVNYYRRSVVGSRQATVTSIEFSVYRTMTRKSFAGWCAWTRLHIPFC